MLAMMKPAGKTLAICDQFRQQTKNIVVGVDFGLLFHEQQPALAAPTHSSRCTGTIRCCGNVSRSTSA